jgi:hypothetical protein
MDHLAPVRCPHCHLDVGHAVPVAKISAAAAAKTRERAHAAEPVRHASVSSHRSGMLPRMLHIGRWYPWASNGHAH